VVTFGTRGSYIQAAQGEAFVQAFPVATVDAAGCGDAFLAALISQLIRSDNWRTGLTLAQLHAYLRYANAAGALTAMAQGVIPALPTAGQVTEFLRSAHDGTNPNEPE
jgi:fructokinase